MEQVGCSGDCFVEMDFVDVDPVVGAHLWCEDIKPEIGSSEEALVDVEVKILCRGAHRHSKEEG